MSVILNIETSSQICSVAVSIDGQIEFHIESEEPMMHAKLLGLYVEKALADVARRELKLDAVAVSLGPGSYTGLRIGLSMAKGLAYSQNIPLIGIPTLELLAVKGMFGLHESEGDELLIPMIDARRMEVYTAVYDTGLNPIVEPTPLILDSDSYTELPADKKKVFVGDGVDKAKGVLNVENAVFLSSSMPTAMDMAALAERAIRKSQYIDVAYSTPIYLKEYQATTPKNKVLSK